jgi:hypothetical protein
MDAMEREHTSLKKVAKYWNIPLNSLSDHLNGRTRCKKVGLKGMLIEQEDETKVIWVLNMLMIRLYVIGFIVCHSKTCTKKFKKGVPIH